MNLKNVDYFNYGLPPDKSSKVYGLYSYSLDRFISVHHDLDIIKQTIVLMSPKIILQVVDLTSAENFFPNIIDTTVCHNWSVQFDKITGAVHFYNTVLSAKSLYEVSNFIEDQQNLEELAKWSELTLFYCHLLTDIKKYQHLERPFPEPFMTEMLNLPTFESSFTGVEQEIYKILYFELDYQTANQKILSIVNTKSRLKNTILEKKIKCNYHC